MKSILTMAWTAEDPAAFDLAAKLAKGFGARLVGRKGSVPADIDRGV